jgi:uncharacterized protein
LHVKIQIASSGESNRWHTQLGGNPVDYSGASKQMSALTTFTTAPLQAPLEITGQPVIRLRLACHQDDPSIIAYLVAVDAAGNSFFVTEGHLRLLQRKLNRTEQTLHTYVRRDEQAVAKDAEMEADLTLLPTSVLLPRGTRLHLLLAAGDTSTFATSGEYDAVVSASSQLELPV